ncbi:hypothetical protein M404DRAFT_28553 [Pisolithus tinctorius Marx 270]|uniref:Uncharacterized protein n=1 Tax=Pisolithus tinctorius Marx 270 TaxID=870435 RepID=A0A0C3JVP5_PISTI|nr:hypothetical protein M404DRAFT_28553 [Pisolithus tinctorius Marx 270]
MSASSRGKRGRKTKEKFPENCGMNLSGNSAATQISLTEEQPLPASDIEWQLQVKAHNHYLNNINSHREDRIPPMVGPSLYAVQPALPGTPEAPTYFTPEHAYEYPYPPMPEVSHSYGPTLGPYTYLPPELDYAPPTLAARFMRSMAPHPTPYSIPLQHPELAQRRLQPGETTPNEAFSIPKRHVIRQVGQTTRSVTRDGSGS